VHASWGLATRSEKLHHPKINESNGYSENIPLGHAAIIFDNQIFGRRCLLACFLYLRVLSSTISLFLAEGAPELFAVSFKFAPLPLLLDFTHG
jgi:hypothetical protein